MMTQKLDISDCVLECF